MLIMVESLLLWCFYYIFFFKQKTAYEMRISDWSSDVRSKRAKAPGSPALVSMGLIFLSGRNRPLEDEEGAPRNQGEADKMVHRHPFAEPEGSKTGEDDQRDDLLHRIEFGGGIDKIGRAS